MSSKVLGALCALYVIAAFPAGMAIGWGLNRVGVPNPFHSGSITVVVAPAAHKVEDRLPQSDFGCKEIYGECDMDQDYVEVPSTVKTPDASFEFVWGPHFQTV